MITDKITALFKFIEFLHSDIKNFAHYNEIVSEFQTLRLEQDKLSSAKNFKDKLKYNEMQLVLEGKFKTIEEDITQPLQAKTTRLNVCDFKKPETLWNWNIRDINSLKEDFNQYDLSEIFLHKSKYVEYKTVMSFNCFHALFFTYLDRILKELFDYFEEPQENKLEVLGVKAVSVNDNIEAVNLGMTANRKLTLPMEVLISSKNQQLNNDEDLLSQQLDNSKSFCFINNFDHVQNERVLSYFKTELVDRNYLTLEVLHKYLIIAFEEKTAPVEKFVINGKFTIGIIRNIFYRYYADIAQDKHGLKNNYCELLGEYFNGFDTDKIKRNFNK